MGVNWNNVLPYYSVKYAKIRDVRLGILQKGLMVAILLKIVGKGMFMQGMHLLEVPVEGNARGQAYQPTVKNCDPMDLSCRSDFSPLADLKYCSQYDGGKSPAPAPAKAPAKAEAKAPESPAPAPAKAPAKAEANAPAPAPKKEDKEEDGKGQDDAPKKEDASGEDGGDKTLNRRLAEGDAGEGETPIPQAECVIFDAPAMARGRSPVPGSLFLPTRISETLQKRGCTLTKENRYACDTKPWVRKDPKQHPKVVFVAEVERFNVLVNQAFESTYKGNTVKGRAFDFKAYMQGQPKLEDMDIKNMSFVQHLKSEMKAVAKASVVPEKAELHKDDGTNHASPFETAYAQTDGDVMSVADILRMADASGAAMLDEPRENGETMRSEGAVVQMHITYDNVKAFDLWGSANATYTITATYLPMKYYRITYDTLLPGGDERTVSNVYGLLILMTVNGKIRTFSISHLLTYLTTAMVSLALATTLTDYMMQYLFAQSARFITLKFQPSLNFGDLSADKAGACVDLLNKKAEAYLKGEDASFEKQDLLAILLKFANRLNRLDALDDINAADGDNACGDVEDDKRDRGSVCLDKWEKNYNETNPSRGVE